MWHLYGLWWALAIVRTQHAQIKEREARIVKLQDELREWQNKFLAKVNVQPLFHTPPPPTPQAPPPPVGISQKKAYLSGVPRTDRSDEDILRAADEAERLANG